MDIMELIATNPNEAVSEIKRGRLSPLPDAEVYAKELNPKTHAVEDPLKRKDKMVKVTTPEGNIINKPVPVERIAIALQKQIVRYAVTFAFGNDVDYAAEIDDDNVRRVYEACMSVLYNAKAGVTLKDVARSVFSFKEAAEVWFVEEQRHDKYGFPSAYKLRSAVLTPAKGDTLYPYFDETGDMKAFGREYAVMEDAKKKVTRFDLYTADTICKLELTGGVWNVLDGYPKANKLGKIPVIYARQEDVEWGDVQGLIERLETLLSNFADTNDYHASPKIVVKGEILSWAQKGDSGAVIEMDTGAEAQYLTWSQAPESVKLEIETIKNFIYSITQTPDLSFENVKGIGAVSGIALKLMFMDAHMKAVAKMDIFGEYLQRRIAVILAFLKQMNAGDAPFVAACDRLTVKPSIRPYMIDDDAAEVSTLSDAFNGGIMSRKTAVAKLGAVNDIDAEMERIEADNAARNGSITGEGEGFE